MGIILKALGSTKGFSFVLVLVSALSLYIAYLEIRTSSLKATNKELEIVANNQGEEIAKLVLDSKENQKLVKKLKKDYESSLKALKQSHEKRLKKTIKITKIKEKVNHAKNSEDGNIAPVMSDALNSLYQLQTNGNQN